ncbi:MAG: nucleoside phosphorylase [Bacteroidota bacterium]
MNASEFILNADGSVYHLHLKPGEVAEKIIFVGDPDRVSRVGDFFDEIELRRQKREFHTLTGVYGGQRMTVISTGIGTDNIDIVWQELDALFNLNFDARLPKTELTTLRVLRLGTCGGLQEHVPVGTIVNSRFAIGADGLMHYYQHPSHPGLSQQWAAYAAVSGLIDVRGYPAEGSSSFERVLRRNFSGVESGITFTAAGFYGPQGRAAGRLPLRFPQLPDRMAGFVYEDYRVLNMEMETAGILGMGQALGHEAASLSVILANRPLGTFADDPAREEKRLIHMGLEAMLRWVN